MESHRNSKIYLWTANGKSILFLFFCLFSSLRSLWAIMFVCYLLPSRIVTEYRNRIPWFIHFIPDFFFFLFCLCWIVENFRCSISLSKGRSFGTDFPQLLLLVSIVFGMMKSHTQRELQFQYQYQHVHCLFTPNIRINIIIFHSLMAVYLRSFNPISCRCVFIWAYLVIFLDFRFRSKWH